MARSDSQQQALSVSGATVPRLFGQRGQIAARAVGERHVLNRARGHSDPNDAFVAVGLQRTAARQRRSQRTRRHRRPGRVISSTGPIARSHVTSGSNRRARLARQGKVVDIGSWSRVVVRAATRVVQYAKAPSRTVVRAQSEKRVKWFGAANGCRVPHALCRASPALASPRAARRVNPAPWHSRASALATGHSTGRSSTQMEPSRLTVCAIMALRRAAHLQRYTDRERRASDLFHPGCYVFLVFIAALD